MAEMDKIHLTIDDIARLAGVAKSTVSRVLNNSGAVSEKTRQKVMDVVQENNFVPNVMARDLSRQETKTIGIFVSDISNQYFAEIIEGAEQIITRANYLPMICLASNPRREDFYIGELLRHRVSGVVVASTAIHNKQNVQRLVQNTKVISIQSDVENVRRIDCTNEKGTYAIISHLLSLGHTKIAYINPQGATSSLEERSLGFEKAMAAFGVPIQEIYTKQIESDKNGYVCAKELLALPCPPTAIHCANDHTAAEAYRAIIDSGLSIPSDISLTGFDNLPNSLLLTPQLTTVAQPIRKMGATAAELLVQDAISGNRPKTKEPIVFETELLVRGSTGPSNAI